jgi:signal peptidase II
MKGAGRSRLLLIIAAVTVLCIDQLVKLWIAANFVEYVSVQLVPWLQPILSITPIRNTGGVFGLFPQFGSIFKYLSLFVVVLIVYYQQKLPVNQYWLHLTLGAVCGGAVSNVIDRFLRGYVLDFIDVNFWPLHNWPLFNIADSAILIGAVGILIDSAFSKQDYVLSNA